MNELDLMQELTAKAEQGDLEACYELGWRQALGNGLPENEPEAVRWLTVAARKGHLLAQNNLGARYVSGEGVPKDLIEAYRWFQLAAEQGDRKAGKNRDSIAVQMSAEQIAEALQRASQT
ncbi:MAG: tetratricopeptide repeat protein [Verrucomicrobiota bacterium]